MVSVGLVDCIGTTDICILCLEWYGVNVFNICIVEKEVCLIVAGLIAEMFF